MRAWLKPALIALHLLLGGAAVAERVGSLGLSPGLVAYAALTALLVAAIAAAAYTRNFVLRWTYAALFFGGACYVGIVERATAEHLTYDAFVTLFQSRGFAGDAVAQYGSAIVIGFLAALPLLFGIGLKPPGKRASRIVAAAPPAALALLAMMLFVRGGDGARGLPGAYTGPAYASLLAWETVSHGSATRQPVTLARTSPPLRRDIVLIVDESVLGTYLDLAGGEVRSGLLDSRPGLQVHNYGHAASATNCSVGTNLTLRHGGTRDAYQRINATMPSIWAYARAAGLRTVYIDAQRTGGALHNEMGRAERAEIDEFVQFDDVAVRDRDMAAADRLAALIENDRSEFILVNKVGAHFPVHDKYPDAFARWRPALPRGLWESVTDTGRRDGFGGGGEEWRRYRNAYRNTLLWNVGHFFDRLLERTDLSGATLIYTSDHGQDLHERGNPGVTTHCSSDPVPEEGVVPLVVAEGAGGGGVDWRGHLAANRDRSSHYNIFPTLLELMGYERGQVAAVYGRSLAEPTQDAFTFNARFNARLGKEPVWRRIELQRLVRAPADQDLASRTH